MNSDSTCSGYCPRPKKSKTSAFEISPNLPRWSLLPSIVLYEIFTFLDAKDRQNASAVCKSWRHILYHPKWWPSIRIKLEPSSIERARFFIRNFGRISSAFAVKVNTLHPECSQQFLALLDVLAENRNLRQLTIEASHCQLSTVSQEDLSRAVETLKTAVLGRLVRFSIGCIEELSLYIDEYLQVMARNRPDQVTHLGLASVKDDPNEYEASYFDCDLLRPFRCLCILSIDYDHFGDDFLAALEHCRRLERLVVHVHGLPGGHPGTSDSAWEQFRLTHPSCELRLSVIHSYEEIKTLHRTVLRERMPLTHLKVFFSECMNLALLEFLYRNYESTLRSLVWVDSANESKRAWSFLSPPYDTTPDPIVMIAWLCKELQELVVHGYKVCEENLIAIARLCGDRLERFEVTELDCVTRSEDESNEGVLTVACLQDIKYHLNRFWCPIKASDLHPVLRDPTAGDSDEYLLPFVLADLQ